MKKIMFFVAACVVFVACQKEKVATDGTHFLKGQEVTITVSTVDSRDGGSKAEGYTDGNNINYNWQKGDKILVTVNGKSSEFTLVGDGGSHEGTFTGEMPAAGKKYTAKYPCENIDLSTQKHIPNGKVDASKMLFETMEAVSLKSALALYARYAMVRFHFNQTSGTTQVSKIELDVTPYEDDVATTKTTYTLDIGETPVVIDDSEQIFTFIVNPTDDASLTVRLYDGNTLKKTFSTGTFRQAIDRDYFLDMPIQDLK